MYQYFFEEHDEINFSKACMNISVCLCLCLSLLTHDKYELVANLFNFGVGYLVYKIPTH